MKNFQEYVQDGEVQKRPPDVRLAKAAALAAEERLQLAKKLRHITTSKYVVENAYEALREAIDAKLFKQGYKSYSHEASIAYLRELNFSGVDIAIADALRVHRNAIKYNAEIATKEEADKSLVAAEMLIRKLKARP